MVWKDKNLEPVVGDGGVGVGKRDDAQPTNGAGFPGRARGG